MGKIEEKRGEGGGGGKQGKGQVRGSKVRGSGWEEDREQVYKVKMFLHFSKYTTNNS